MVTVAKMKGAKSLTLAAMLAALAVVFLYLTSVLPTGGLAFSALAAVCTAIVFQECGLAWSVAHYTGTGLLALLLVPEKTYVLWFLLALGHYSVFKPCIEKLKHSVSRWVLKLAVFGASMLVLLWLLSAAFVQNLPLHGPVLWLTLTIVFVVYDIGLSGVMRYYRSRVRRR